jgi:hypothetical protein
MGIKLVTNRNITVVDTAGNAIAFKKGKPEHVPDHFIEACMSKGAIPVDEEELQKLSEEEDKFKPKDVPVGIERKKTIVEAFEHMVKKNERGSFTANGVPKIKNLTELLKFDVDTREITALWKAYDAARKGGEPMEFPGTVADPNASAVITDDGTDTE